MINYGDKKLNLYPDLKNKFTLWSKIKSWSLYLQWINDFKLSINIVNIGWIEIMMITIFFSHISQPINKTFSKCQNLRIWKMFHCVISWFNNFSKWLCFVLNVKLILSNTGFKRCLRHFCQWLMFWNKYFCLYSLSWLFSWNILLTCCPG